MYVLILKGAKFMTIHLEMEWMDLCSLKPLWSGMGEVVPARTSLTLHPHPLPLCCNILFKSVPVHRN